MGNISHVEEIKREMQARGWKAAKLSKLSGVSTGVLSRYFNNHGISSNNLYAIMTTLGITLPTTPPLENNSTPPISPDPPSGPSLWDYTQQLTRRIDGQSKILSVLNERIEGIRAGQSDTIKNMADRVDSHAKTLALIESRLTTIEARLLIDEAEHVREMHDLLQTMNKLHAEMLRHHPQEEKREYKKAVG
jgi:transcriptional regulator with XRE-family HTH domain